MVKVGDFNVLKVGSVGKLGELKNHRIWEVGDVRKMKGVGEFDKF